MGFLEGTLFPLCFYPRTNDCVDFFGRKLGYYVSVIIASDENLFIRRMNACCSGCARDDRMLMNSKLQKKCINVF